MVKEAENLNIAIKEENQALLHKEVAGQSLKYFAEISAGIEKFTTSQYKQKPPNAGEVWQSGCSKLLDYGLKNDGDVIALFVPSLINRAYIFDLSEEASMLGYYKQQNINCALLDWGIPDKDEADFAIDDYITRLQESINYLAETYGKKIVLVGYCMGGLLCLGASLKNSQHIAGVTFLATPWDFKAADVKQYNWSPESIKKFDDVLSTGDFVSGELVYYLLYLQNPWVVMDKFARFSKMDQQSEQAIKFIKRENWVHDSVPVTKAVAKEIFINWGIDNITNKGQWKVGDILINPAELKVPSFVAMASGDTVVPQLCATALVNNLPNPQKVFVQSGHVGMVVGKNAEKNLWIPLANWLNSL